MSLKRSLHDLGRYVYGVGAVALGVIGLAWGDFATPWQPVPDSVSHRAALAYLVAVSFLLAGMALSWKRSAKIAAAILATLYFLSALLWLPRVIGYPGMIGTWLGFAEQFALTAAGVMAYALVGRDVGLWTLRVARIERCLFGLCVIVFGLAHMFALKETAAMVPPWIPPGPHFWAIATGIAHLLAGIALLTKVVPTLAARLLTAMLFLFGALVWAPLLVNNPHVHMMWAGNAINLVFVGAAWIVADWR